MRISDWSSDVCSSDLIWDEHESAFGAPVYFGQSCNALVFRPALLDRQMLSRDLALLSIMQTCLESLGSQGRSSDGLFERLSRSEERRVGKECVSTCRSRWSP